MVSVPIPGTISPNRLMKYWRTCCTGFRPHSGDYISKLSKKRNLARFIVRFRPHSGDYISKFWITVYVHPCQLESFRPHSGDYISKSGYGQELFVAGGVSVPIPGTISPNWQAWTLTIKYASVSVPIPGTISPNPYILNVDGSVSEWFPSPFRGLYLQILKMLFTVLYEHASVPIPGTISPNCLPTRMGHPWLTNASVPIPGTISPNKPDHSWQAG